MHVWVGQPIKAGDLIAIVGEGGALRGSVFIGYRRSDSSGYTGRIYDGVVRDLWHQQVFRDIGSLKPGRDFVQQVAAALRRTRVIVVVIAPGWLNAVDHRGQCRLADPHDLHRVEIRTTLERGAAVLPVLVGGANMPRRDQLPGDIQALAHQQAIEISDHHWDADAQRLSSTIRELLEESRRGDQSQYR